MNKQAAQHDTRLANHIQVWINSISTPKGLLIAQDTGHSDSDTLKKP